MPLNPNRATESTQVDSAHVRRDHLRRLYGPDDAPAVADALEKLLDAHPVRPRSPLRPGETWLIAYPDQFRADRTPPLRSLRAALDQSLRGLFTGVHVLPFCPWSSDDGFAVTDYRAVEPSYGSWGDIEALGTDRRLMVDAVVNHLSSESVWFAEFLADEPGRRRYFRTEEPGTDVSAVVRPRTHPLLTRFESATGPRWVWTTFSPDQVDLDYATPAVLLETVAIVLDYARRGASAIRLDAVGFLWKDPARTSLHLPETHTIVRLLRSCLDTAAPGTLLITETNVPHEENLRYLDADQPQAHAVYQFPLAPLVAHAILTGDAEPLRRWAQPVVEDVAPGRTFVNLLASHDGIGLRPAEGILTAGAIAGLVAACHSAGGEVSMRATGAGDRPYELNTTWFDLMAAEVDEPTAIRRHIASHAAMMFMPGIPAVYAHSLFGSSNDRDAFASSGQPRSLNRHKFDPAELHSIVGPGTRGETVLTQVGRLIESIRRSGAFHPEDPAELLDGPAGVLGIRRAHAGNVAECWVNLSDRAASVAGQTLNAYDYRITRVN